MLLWLATAALMARSAALDPYDPQRSGTSGYGHNHDGALLEGLVATAIELLVLCVILRPWSLDRTRWGRALVVCLVFTPWAITSAMLSMHAGGIFMLHFLWNLAISALAALLALGLGIAAIAYSGMNSKR